MGLKPIPTAWCRAVCAALRQGSRSARYTESGRQRWELEFPAAFRSDLDESLVRALSAPNLVGCPVQMDDPPGETWEFYFQFQSEKLYGKILLKRDRKQVVVFSAHRPGKSKLRCE